VSHGAHQFMVGALGHPVGQLRQDGVCHPLLASRSTRRCVGHRSRLYPDRGGYEQCRSNGRFPLIPNTRGRDHG
jgi:hypothetical protein